jgi:hypothetical protein
MVILISVIQQIMTGQISKERWLILFHYECCVWVSHVKIWAFLLLLCTKICTYHHDGSFFSYEGRQVGKMEVPGEDPIRAHTQNIRRLWEPTCPAPQIQGAMLSLLSSSTYHLGVMWRCVYSQRPYSLPDRKPILPVWLTHPDMLGNIWGGGGGVACLPLRPGLCNGDAANERNIATIFSILHA